MVCVVRVITKPRALEIVQLLLTQIKSFSGKNQFCLDNVTLRFHTAERRSFSGSCLLKPICFKCYLPRTMFA